MMRVVVCDDEPLARERLTRIVKEEGHEVVAQATTGLEAIQAVKQTHPDVILLDIRMPEMDGIETARQGLIIDTAIFKHLKHVPYRNGIKTAR